MSNTNTTDNQQIIVTKGSATITRNDAAKKITIEVLNKYGVPVQMVLSYEGFGDLYEVMKEFE